MSANATPSLKKTFPLDPNILGPKSAASLEMGATTAPDVILAIAGNLPFPARPNRVIDLSDISLNASGGLPVAFQGDGVTLGFSFSAGVTAGAAVYDRAEDALASLVPGGAPGLEFSALDKPRSRYVLLQSGYRASGSVTGSHPIGVLGSFTFGAQVAASGISAVLHRFPISAGADTALKETVQSWKLPCQVDSAAKLSPATWIVTEANGSLAVQLAASLGYKFNFVRQAKGLGLSGDIGLKIDAAAMATFGFDVSGRFLVVVGRESDDAKEQKIRLRLFKLASSGMQFGLNLNLSVTGVETFTPNKADDFVKAVFGVHGAQIVRLLGQVEKWTDPKQDVGQLVAGLANEKALDLFKRMTGEDAEQAFDAARNKLLHAIQQYQGLPSTVSSELLGLMNQLDAPATAALRSSLNLLQNANPQAQQQALTDLFSSSGFTQSPAGRLLLALADQGLLQLLDRLPEVRTVANTLVDILDGGVIAKLQNYLNTEFDLNKVLAAVQQADFKKLDSFLVGRLSVFFGKTLGFNDLNEVKNAINLVVSKRQEVYDKARKALNSTYGMQATATWNSTSSSTAVIDAEFDLSDAAAEKVFHAVMQGKNGAFDELLTDARASVHLNYAVLSHELTRKSSVEVSLPLFNFQTQSVTTALASVKPEDESGRVLLYDATGTNTVSVRNKFASSLSVTLAAMVTSTGSAASFPDLRIHSTDSESWSYRLLYAKAAMKREELEAITRPFLAQYMAAQFAQGTSLSTWYNLLESTSESKLHNGPEIYGDVCAAFEVTLPGQALGAWTQRLKDVSPAAKRVSIAIQRALKTNLPLFYLNDIAKLGTLGNSAPFLVWASIPPSVSFNGKTFSETAGKAVYWDQADATLRQAAVRNSQTATNLLLGLPELRLRLEEAGLHKVTGFYQNDQVSQILGEAGNDFGDELLKRLLTFESNVVFKANDALNDMQKFLASASSTPSKAVVRLAKFAADITAAFNQLIGKSDFADLKSFRAVAQVVFAEASRALSNDEALGPRAMLTLDILNPAGSRKSQLSDFLAGGLPASGDIAVAQRLVSG
jgi:hypothetical protein